MSYDIYIGNAEMQRAEGHYVIDVRETHHPDAPTFANDEMTNNGNDRHPGYSAWSGFCEQAGLYDLFFDSEHALMCEHPGNAVLTAKHAQTIENALNTWKSQHPDAVAGFPAHRFHDEEQEVGACDPILARLIWLDWWVKWALENCEHPCIVNW